MEISVYKLLAIAVALVLGAAVPAQVQRREVVKATTPEQDAKGLNPEVPASFAVPTQFERVVIVRMKNQSDILAELEKQVKAEGIQNGVILGGVGSAISTHHHVVSNRGFPSRNLYVEDPEASADIVHISGMVLNGRLHPHIAFANGEHMFGGHLEPRTRVFTFAVVTIAVLPSELDLSRLDDKTLR